MSYHSHAKIEALRAASNRGRPQNPRTKPQPKPRRNRWPKQHIPPKPKAIPRNAAELVKPRRLASRRALSIVTPVPETAPKPAARKSVQEKIQQICDGVCGEPEPEEPEYRWVLERVPTPPRQTGTRNIKHLLKR